VKENLQLKKFTTEKVHGVYNIVEEPTFFCSKVMDIEDIVEITDKSIEYYQIYENGNPYNNNGYQYFVKNFTEQFYILDAVKLKLNNHNIVLVQQSSLDEQFNTKWQIQINVKTILTEYLFAKIKEARTFKSMKPSNFINNNINQSVYDYITNNLLDRYRFSKLDLFVQYIDIKNNQLYSDLAIKQYDPMYSSSIELDEYIVKNLNLQQDSLVDTLADVYVLYSQIKPSTDYKFDYYFNVYFEKI